MTKYVSSRVVLNSSMINSIRDSAVKALEMTGEYVLGEVVNAQVVPFGDSFERGGETHKGGTLQSSGYANTDYSSHGHVYIVFSTPYARRLYFHPEYNFRKEDNPSAKGEWLKDWTESGKYADEVKAAYMMFLGQLTGIK